MTQGSRWLWHQPLLWWTQRTHGFWPDGLHQWFRPASWLHFFGSAKLDLGGLESNRNDTTMKWSKRIHLFDVRGKACAGRDGSNDCLKMFEASNLVPWFSTNSVWSHHQFPEMKPLLITTTIITIVIISSFFCVSPSDFSCDATDLRGTHPLTVEVEAGLPMEARGPGHHSGPIVVKHLKKAG